MIRKKTSILMLLQLNQLHWHQMSWIEAYHIMLKITAVTTISQNFHLKRVYRISLTNIPLMWRKVSSLKMGHPFMNHHQTTPWKMNECNFLEYLFYILTLNCSSLFVKESGLKWPKRIYVPGHTGDHHFHWFMAFLDRSVYFKTHELINDHRKCKYGRWKIT